MEANNNETRMQVQQMGEEQSESIMSLRDYLDFLRDRWYLILISSFVCVFIAWLYLSTQNNVYQRQAVMLVKEDNTTMMRGADALMQINGMMSGSNVANETYILGTRYLAREVVKNLGLDILYSHKGTMKDVSLYENKPFVIQFQDEKTIPATFLIEVLNASECEILEYEYVPEKAASTVKEETPRRVKFGERVQTNAGTFTLIPDTKDLEPFIGEKIIVSHLTIEQATNIVASRVNTSEVNKMATLVRISYVDTSIKRADDILNSLLEAYKKSIIDDKNMVSQSTARFIDDRVRIVGKELSSVESSLAAFKQANKLVDVTQNAQSFFAQTNSARQRTIQLQAQQAAVNYLLDYLKSSGSGDNLIPTLGGLTDAGIQNQIAKYNEMKLQRNRLAENSGEEGITLKTLDANLKEMRYIMLASMEGYKNSIEQQVKLALQEERALQGSIQSMPQQEKQAISISRQQAIKEELYTYLLNKREETALQLAVNEANVRVVEPPYGTGRPISPRRQIILLIGLLAGIALPFAGFYGYSVLNMRVRGRKDVETYTTLPILAEIPRYKDKDNDNRIMVNEKSNDMLSEAFRLMRYNLSFLNRDAKVIMFTSTIPSEGKSFVSRNFAYSLAVKDKKVILIDCDIRRQTQSCVLGFQTAKGLTNYLSGEVSDIQELIAPAQDGSRVKIMPAGPLPPNPTELLMDERMSQLIEQLRKEYDYVVLDSVPAQMMADAALVSQLSDLTVYVVRVGGIDRRYLSEIDRLYREKRYSNMCILLNAVVEEKRSYGYYGNGAYGYGGYSYRKEDSYPNTLWRGLCRVLKRKRK